MTEYVATGEFRDYLKAMAGVIPPDMFPIRATQFDMATGVASQWVTVNQDVSMTGGWLTRQPQSSGVVMLSPGYAHPVIILPWSPPIPPPVLRHSAN